MVRERTDATTCPVHRRDDLKPGSPHFGTCDRRPERHHHPAAAGARRTRRRLWRHPHQIEEREEMRNQQHDRQSRVPAQGDRDRRGNVPRGATHVALVDHLGHVRLCLRHVHPRGRDAGASRNHPGPARNNVDRAPSHVDRDTARPVEARATCSSATTPIEGARTRPTSRSSPPCFFDGHIIAVASTIAHHIDIGGRVPCTTAIDNAEVFRRRTYIPSAPHYRWGETESNSDRFRFGQRA